MLSLGGIISLTLIVVILSKRIKKVTYKNLLLVAGISLLQVCLVLIIMYTMGLPVIEGPK